MDLSIIVVSFNTREVTLACLRSVYAHTSGIVFEVIVVDNASRDGSADAVAREFPQVKLIRQTENAGFARANNLAAREAAGEYLLLLNSDTLVRDDALAKLLGFARSRSDVGIVGGRTLYGDGSLNPTSCFGLPTPWSLFCQGTGLSTLFRSSRVFNPEAIGGWERDSLSPVGVVTGCFLLIRRPLWDRLGGFDEAFFMYSEDTDLSARCWRAGFACMHYPDATIVHLGGRSEQCRADKMIKVFRAKAQFMYKHWPKARARFGVLMLDLHAASRARIAALVAPVDARASHARAQWARVWRQRAAWHCVGAGSAAAPPARPPARATDRGTEVEVVGVIRQ